MIISHKYKFIFIKTRKTAGTSVEVALERECDDGDIVTPVSPKYQDPEVAGHQARNYEGFTNHMAAREIKRLVPDSIWNNYTKFTFDRNPWDKMVSMYWWRKYQYQINESFRDFCIKSCDLNNQIYTAPSDFDKYTEAGKIIVDYVGRFENLQEEFRRICKYLGMSVYLNLPIAKGKIRQRKDHYTTYYDDRTRELVASRFSQEIDTFGYSFEDETVMSGII